jgi:hypothetical protein
MGGVIKSRKPKTQKTTLSVPLTRPALISVGSPSIMKPHFPISFSIVLFALLALISCNAVAPVQAGQMLWWNQNGECLGPPNYHDSWDDVGPSSASNCSAVINTWGTTTSYVSSDYACNATGVNHYDQYDDEHCADAITGVLTFDTVCSEGGYYPKRDVASSSVVPTDSHVFTCDDIYQSPPFIRIQTDCGNGDSYWTGLWRNTPNTCHPVYNSSIADVSYWAKQDAVCFADSASDISFNIFTDDQCTIASHNLTLHAGCNDAVMVALLCEAAALSPQTSPFVAPVEESPAAAPTSAPLDGSPSPTTVPVGSPTSGTPTAPTGDAQILSFGISAFVAIIALVLIQ